MHPIRILILAVLFYILYRLLFGGSKKRQATSQVPPEIPVQDTLSEDPICHTYVPQSQSLSVEHDGKTHYFCSEECLNKFTNQQQRRDS
ncbi:MAG: YHS domain-containing protein [Proteobacteria bacterium]|nr:YHS domain-containing protein [Pseudomonadota bacterium]MBU1641169.1 YHS domain-containing protein [Pseudomonadota bacterium]